MKTTGKRPLWHQWPWFLFGALALLYALVRTVDYWIDRDDRAISKTARSAVYSCAEMLGGEDLIGDVTCGVEGNRAVDLEDIQPGDIERIDLLAVDWSGTDVEMAAFLQDLLALLKAQYGMDLGFVSFYCSGTYPDRPPLEAAFSFSFWTSTSELLSMPAEDIVETFIQGQY
ncbi:hypothetical protein D7V91_08745 [bacterium 1xD42-67]|nr:hypothetical protein D7V91_08745 [bacterium 1xD42-67]